MEPKTVLITGSSRGIGAATALAFAKKGYQVIINSHKSAEQLGQLKHTLDNLGQHSCMAHTCDISKEEEVSSLFDKIAENYNGVDILINNAGISYVGLLTDMSFDEWKNIIDTNLSSAFLCCKNAIPYMLQQKQGKIINISSVWGDVGASCEAAYSASKSGLNGLTKALAKELAPSNIQVNALSCGAIDTAMNNNLTTEEKRQLADEIPAGRFGTVDEAAAYVLNMAESPAYLTGQIIGFDGGWI